MCYHHLYFIFYKKLCFFAIEYPINLHDTHAEYPLAPERLKVLPNMVSNKQREIYCKIRGDDEIKETLPKLIPNLYNKTNYVVHYRNLQLYTSLGMVVKKVHKILKFRQSPWLKTYIDFNTRQRALARNDFEKDFFKLMNNSMFGKTMENLRNRRKVDLVNKEWRLKKIVAQPTFKSFTIFHQNLLAVERTVSELTLNRPIYIGFCVLDLSKTLMYNWHYHYVKQKYPDIKSKLLFTDTDSLVYKIQTEDLFNDMLEDQHKFDFSGYSHDHICYSTENKKVIGKMKDELNGVLMREFVGLRAKMYSLEYDNKSMKKAKGVKKYVIKKNINHADYRSSLFNSEEYLHQMNSIRSMKHILYSLRQNKRTLSAYDDKRFILGDGISTLPYGHYSLSS